MNKKEYNYFYKKDGFTYVELLIVVGIMIIFGVFFVMAVDPVGKIKAQRDSQRESDINSVLLSVEQKIRNDRGWDCLFGPLPQDKFTAIGTGPGEYDLYSCLMPNYLSKYLVDPKEGSITGRNITDGLVGHWKFDEGSGTIAYDASGNGNDGTLVNGPNWVDGKRGGALGFDGSSNYVDCGNDESLNITDEITISAWIYPKGFHDHWPCIVSKGPSWESGVTLWMNWNGLISFAIAGQHYYFQYVDLNSWNHVVATFSLSDEKILVYKNGLSSSPIGRNTALPGHDSMRVGISSPGTYPSGYGQFNGLIDDVRIYDRALSPEEIQDLYNYEYSSKYAIWQNPVTKNISLKSLESETKEVFTGASD